MPNEKVIRIIKVPLPNGTKQTDLPAKFPRMGRLYLELFENKAKIKQDLINKEYVPRKITEEIHENRQKEKEIKEVKTKEIKTKEEKVKENTKQNTKEDNKNYREEQEIKIQKSEEESKDNQETKPENNDSDNESVSSSESDDLAKRLKELLKDDKSSESEKSENISVGKSSEETPKKKKHKSKSYSVNSKYTPYEKYKSVAEENKKVKEAPTLAELQAKGYYTNKPELRDINNITTNEIQEEDLKREILFKFGILKKSYSHMKDEIPDYTIHTEYKSLKRSYEETLKKISIENSVGNYKNYMSFGFVAVEYILSNFFNFDMEGFSKQQMVNMQQYESLLIELGEKSYVPSGSKWPVELRLLFAIMMQAGFFILTKIIMKKTGAHLMGMMNQNNSNPNKENVRKGKMKGPDININNI